MRHKDVRWKALAALPNIDLMRPFENKYIAIVPYDDRRMEQIYLRFPKIRLFAEKFTTEFGKQIRPAFVITRYDVPPTALTREAVSGFRDALAISTITYNRAVHIASRMGNGPQFSNYFLLYPWMVDRFGEQLIAETPASLGLDEVDDFRGQSTPALFRKSLDPSVGDETLSETLVERWNQRFVRKRPNWTDIALFRSLNMANQAAMMPGGSETTIYDYGRSIVLWVSAFERPCPSGRRRQCQLATGF